jgi:hypothetical protein
MGGVNSTLSKNTTDVINKTVNDITTNITNKCNTNDSNIQKISFKIGNISGCDINFSNFGQTINSNVSADCTQTNVTANDLKSAMNNNLQSYADTLRTSGSLALAETTKSENYTKLQNIVNNDLVLNDLSEAINTLSKEQDMTTELGNIICYPYTDSNGVIHNNTVNFSDLTQNIVSNVVSKALQSNNSLNTAVNNFDNTVSSTAKATAKGMFDGIAGIAGSITGSIFMIIFGLIFVLAFFPSLLKGIMPGGGNGNNNGESSGSGSGSGSAGVSKAKKKMVAGALVIIFILLAIGLTVNSLIYFDGNIKQSDKSTINGIFYASCALAVVTFLLFSIYGILFATGKTGNKGAKYLLIACMIFTVLFITISVSLQTVYSKYKQDYNDSNVNSGAVDPAPIPNGSLRSNNLNRRKTEQFSNGYSYGYDGWYNQNINDYTGYVRKTANDEYLSQLKDSMYCQLN